MEPASVIGVIGVVAQVIQAIYAYGEAVLECKNEVAHLRAELFGMHAALTQIEQDLAMVGEGGSQSLASPNLRSLQSQQMLDETRAILEKLAGALKYGLSRPHRLVRRLVRPLKRSQVQALATHLERLKTFFILTATKDTLQAAQDTKKSIHTLRNTIQDIQQTKEEESVYLDAMKWLAPCTPHIAHAAALSARLAGTNSWFLEEAFCEWTVGTTHILWLKGKPGSGKTCLTAACTDKYAALGRMGRKENLLMWRTTQTFAGESHRPLFLLLLQRLIIPRAPEYPWLANSSALRNVANRSPSCSQSVQ